MSSFIKKENAKQRSKRILQQLMEKYPGKKAYDLDGRGLHFVCEVEPSKDHWECDRAIEVILSSRPHKHLKMTQYYTILSGSLELYLNGEKVILHSGDVYTIKPGVVHWAKSNCECWLDIYSKPGWTQEDHILTDNE